MPVLAKSEEIISTIIVICAFVFIFIFDMVSGLFWAGIVLLIKATKPLRNVINFIWITALTIKRGLKMKKKKHWMKAVGIILGTAGAIMQVAIPGSAATIVCILAGGITALGGLRNVNEAFDKKVRNEIANR